MCYQIFCHAFFLYTKLRVCLGPCTFWSIAVSLHALSCCSTCSMCSNLHLNRNAPLMCKSIGQKQLLFCSFFCPLIISLTDAVFSHRILEINMKNWVICAIKSESWWRYSHSIHLWRRWSQRYYWLYWPDHTVSLYSYNFH